MEYKEFTERYLRESPSLLNAVRGVYTDAFMQIRLAFHYDRNIRNLSLEDRATFLHEYIHYLQNISTPFELYGSMLRYKEMVDLYAKLQQLPLGSTIKLPIVADHSPETVERHSRYLLSIGEYRFSEFSSQVIDVNSPITVNRQIVTFANTDIPIITINATFGDGTPKEFVLGSLIIEESMAAMYQHLLDSNSTHTGIDVPYNLIQLLCRQHYPEIADDECKLITLCYISLFSMNPGPTLIEQMEYATQHLEMHSVELFEHFVNSHSIIVNGVRKSVVEFFDSMIDDFKQILEKALMCPLDYIGVVLDRVKLSNGFVPIITLIEDGTMSDEKMSILLDYLSIPYVYTDMGEYYFPESPSTPGKESNDMIALIGHHALFSYLSSDNHQCPLSSLTCSTKPECRQTPWEGAPCPIQVMAETFGVNSLRIEP